jgi:hypothetical protein
LFGLSHTVYGQKPETKSTWPYAGIESQDSVCADAPTEDLQSNVFRWHSDLLASDFSIEHNGIKTEDGIKYYIGIQDRDDTGLIKMPIIGENHSKLFRQLE